MAVQCVVGDFLTPLALPQSRFGLLVPRILDGIHSGSEDVLGKVPVCGQFDNGMGVEAAVGISGHKVICAVAHNPMSVVELVFQGT